MTISRALIIGTVMALFLTLAYTLPGEKGLIKVHHLHQELNTLTEQNNSLRQKNYTLAQEAHLLRENLAYIEHVIIKEMNMVRPGDTIIVFKSKTK